MNYCLAYTILYSEHVSGAGRKSGEWERSGERRSQMMMERERSAERGVAERERSGERAESSAQRPLFAEVDPTVRGVKCVPVIINLNVD